MIVDLILIELLVGAMLLGFMGSFKKRMVDRIILFVTIPISFLIAILLTKGGYYAELLDFVMENIDIEGLSGSMRSLVEALIGALARPFVVVILFWVLLFVFRITIGFILLIVHLILHTRRKEKQRVAEGGKKRSRTNKIVTATLGVASGFLVCMLSFLPFVYLSDMTQPAMQTALAEENKGTYAYEVASEVEKVGVPFEEGSIIASVAKYTGIRAVFNASLKSMTDVEVELDGGKKVEFNSIELVSLAGKSGVKAAVLYEKSCAHNATLADFEPVSDVLRELAESDTLMELCAQMLSTIEIKDSAGSVMGDLVNEYKNADKETVRQDVIASAELAKLICTDLAYVGLDRSEWLPAVLDYMQNEECSEKLVDTVALTNLYNKGFPTFMEFGLTLITQAMGLSDNRDDDHNNYKNALYESMNDKSLPVYSTEGAEAFIRYCADNALSVKDYGITDPENLTELDLAYTSYVYYFARMQAIKTVFDDYLLDNGKGVCTYITNDASRIYVYNSETGMWSYYSGEEINAASAVGGLLANGANDIISTTPGAIITQDDVADIARVIASGLPGTGDEALGGVALLLRSIFDKNHFTPSSVYADDIVGALNKDAELDDEHNAQLAITLSIMAGIYADISEDGDGASVDTVMDHFGEIGRMLDCLAKMESTKNVPDKMLAAIMNNKNYSVYFDSEPVQLLIDNVKAGESTYEELFSYVQAIYNIASGIMPDAAI